MIMQSSDSWGGGQELGRKRNNAMTKRRSEYRTSVVVLHHHMNVFNIPNRSRKWQFCTSCASLNENYLFCLVLDSSEI